MLAPRAAVGEPRDAISLCTFGVLVPTAPRVPLMYETIDS